jgi:serine/threonine-protein kinase
MAVAAGNLLSVDSQLDVTRDGGCESQCFCPHVGLIAKSSIEFRQQVRDLLRGRLRIAAILLFGGTLAFLIRDFIVQEGVYEHHVTSRIPHILVTIIEGLFAVFLCRRCTFSLLTLRIVEVVMFGAPALFLAYMQYGESLALPAADLDTAGLELLVGGIPWLLTLLIYGLFIPNGWRRATAVVSVLALGPLASVLLAGLERPELMTALVESGAISANLLHMTVGSIIAVWGSHRFGTLRREAFDLRNVGVYTLIRPLGSGGMGEVFLAEHKLLKRPCAVKLIRPDRGADPRSIARFQDEVQATARLTHPNTVEIYDYGVTDNGTFFYVMEFLPGMSLEEIVERSGPMPAGRVIHLLRQVCSALAEAHHAGMIHRDLKPGNIFAAERGGIYDFAKILDFGLVKSTDPESQDVRHTLEGFAVGSPLYAAPEVAQSKGMLDGRTDIYSLGATAYYLLTGRPVFAGDSAIDIMIAHRKERPARPSELRDGIPADLEAVVLRCLAKSPDDRFADVEELEAALANCVDAGGWDSEAARKWWERTPDETAPAHAGDSVDAFAVTTIGAPAMV